LRRATFETRDPEIGAGSARRTHPLRQDQRWRGGEDLRRPRRAFFQRHGSGGSGLIVIASQRIRPALAGPMTSSAKQSRTQLNDWITSSLTLGAKTSYRRVPCVTTGATSFNRARTCSTKSRAAGFATPNTRNGLSPPELSTLIASQKKPIIVVTSAMWESGRCSSTRRHGVSQKWTLVVETPIWSALIVAGNNSRVRLR